jgi:hypothetical protein
MSFIVDYNITKFQINQDSVEVWKLLNRYIVQWDEKNIFVAKRQIFSTPG